MTKRASRANRQERNHMNYDRFDEARLKEALRELPLALRVLATVDSTNSEAKRYALAGGRVPAAFLAEAQTAGRGRMGRSFYSPDGTGIYLSLLFSVDGDLRDVTRLTSAAAVGVLRAIRGVTGLSPKIKWVNDLYHDGKKICGILAESFLVGSERYGILGVGVNLCTADFPQELVSVAGSLLPDSDGRRNALAAELIRELHALTAQPIPADFIEEYRAASMVLGQSVFYTENGVTHEGCAEAIDEGGRLTVRHPDGSTHLLCGGEISLRLTGTDSNHQTKEGSICNRKKTEDV